MRATIWFTAAFLVVALVTRGWQPVNWLAIGGAIAGSLIVGLQIRDAWRGRARRRTLAGMATIDATEFERMIAQCLRRDGWTVEHRGGAGDQGIDVLARRGELLLAIQCKRYSPQSSIAPAVVRELYGAARGAGASVAVLVTTARISDAGKRWSDELGENALPMLFVEGADTVEYVAGRQRLRPREAKNLLRA